MSTNDHSVCWNANTFDMAMWMMAVEDKFTPWIQRCSGVNDINVTWKDFMETFAEVADHIVGRRPKSKSKFRIVVDQGSHVLAEFEEVCA